MVALTITLILFNFYRENNKNDIPKIINISKCLPLYSDLKQRHRLLNINDF